jgi:penicillin-binding protein 1A
MAQKNTTKVKDIKYYSRKFWRLFFYTLGGVFLFFLFASWGLFGTMPSFEDLENPESNLATEVISSDGVTLGKFYNENRTAIKYKDLPKSLVDALVSTEDERFYEHSGIDAKRTFGAALKLGKDGGASTITQQLAKLLFHGEGSKFLPFRIVQKAKEWIIAIRLERQYTKNEIIAMYFNRVDFVNNAVGIRSASKVYFNVEPRDLTIEQSAMLVGMLTNPSLFNPIRRPEKALKRRNIVLGQLVRNNHLEDAARKRLEKKPIKLDFHPESHLDGTATYFREYLRDYMKNWIKDHKKPDGDDYDIYSDG